MSATGRCAALGLGAFVCAALALAASSPAASARASASLGRHADGAEGAALDLSAVALTQVGPSLVLDVKGSKSLRLRQHASARSDGRVCLLAGRQRLASRVCVRRAGVHLRTTHAKLAQDGSVTGRVQRIDAKIQEGRRGMRITVGLSDLGLRRGRLRWSVEARQLGNCEPREPGSGKVPERETSGQPPALCQDTAPNTGSYAARLRRVVRTGCVTTGRPYVVRGSRSKRWIALTFDDGPGPLTPAFLHTLSRLRIPATFFLVGQNLAGQTRLVRRMLNDGHMIAGHSWNHANLGGGGPGASSQIRRTREAIRRATGFAPCMWRAPYGSVSRDLIARARAIGELTIQWDVDPRDWSRPGSTAIASRVLSRTKPGSIVVMHDGGAHRAQTLAALPDIARRLRARGYRFVTVAQMLGLRDRFALVR